MKTTSGSKDPSNTKGPETEDNSVTFSLSALMAQGNKKDAPSGGATKEDSGLIDLNALAAMEASAPARPSPVPSLGLFPFDAPPIAAAPPPVAPAPEVVEPPKPRRGLLVLGGIGAVALAVGAFYFGMSGGAHADTAANSAQSTIEAAHTTPVANETVAAPDPNKVVAADPGALKEKEPPPAPSAKAPPPTGRGKLAKSDTSDKKTSADPPKEEKKAASSDPCHGDLMCAMQRATKK